jgi:hypothetical protein
VLQDPDIWRAMAEERVQSLIRDARAAHRRPGRHASSRRRLAVLLRSAANRLDPLQGSYPPGSISGGWPRL